MSLKNIFGEQVKEYQTGDNVEKIGNYAFYKCSELTSVTIGNSVTSIGDYAFQHCISLTSVTISNSVTNIESSAFSGCYSLTSVCIGNSVTNIGDYAFLGCIGLTFVTINNNAILSKNYSSSNSLKNIFGEQVKEYQIGDNVEKIGNYAFYGCTGLTSFTIPNSVTSIGSSAFSGCTGLISFTIPNSVTSIGDFAFRGCTGLTSVTIPNSVTSIGRWFEGCTGLASVTIPNSVKTIENYAFKGCSGLKNITIPNSVTSIGNLAFQNCTGLIFVTINNNAILSKNYSSSNSLKNIFGEQVKEYQIGDNVEKIGNYAFYGCSGLISATIPNSVTSIGNYAFQDCTGLTSIDIPNSVTSIGFCAFEGCTGLASVTIPNSVTSIGFSAFKGCTGLASVTIPNSVKTIENRAFKGCSGLKNITIPNSVTSIGNDAFSGCRSLTSVTIPNSVTSIGSYAFYGCTGLTSVTIGNSVTSIGDYAFQYCRGLTSVTIPNSVTSIGDYAFQYCRGLTSVTIPNSVTSIGREAFDGCSGLTSVTIGNSVTSIGYEAFRYCTGLTSVTIGNSVTSIGNYAFADCNELTEIYCYIEEPLTINVNVFFNVRKNTCTLHVPIGTGDAYCNANVWKEFNIVEDLQSRMAQSITWAQSQIYVVGLNSDIELTAVASSGLPVTYSVKSGSDCATLITSGDKTSLKGIKPGTVIVEAKQVGNSEYQPASVEKEFTINKKTSQRITWSQEIEAVVGDSLILSATSSSGLPVAYRALDEDYCSKMEIKQNAEGQYVVYFSSGAPFIIEAYQDGNDVYNAAEPVRKYYNSLNPTETDGLMCINGIYYKYTDNTHTALKMVRGFKQYKGDMVFPAVVNGLPVTNMESDATYICPIITSIEFEEGHSRIEGIHYDMALEKLILPSTTTYIDYLVLHCCPKLKDVYLYATTPPEVSSYCDYDQWTEGEGKTLYVPRGTKSAYENADFWKHFTIVEIDVPTGIISIDNSQSAIDNDVWFTINGTRLNGKPTKAGIYIVNGKKVVIK
ncbi:leucine-rich repeat protein [Prevotella sp. Rep29]|nr:leucine-rich repeat protein [Prevotella sp. Rep29]